jgi:hypothetical protein
MTRDVGDGAIPSDSPPISLAISAYSVDLF